MEEERLDVFSSLATGVAVADVTDGHLARQLCHILLIENFVYKSISFYSMELACRTDGDDAAALLAAVLEGVQAVVCEACSVFYSIDSEDSTFVVEFVVSEITLTHFVSIRSPVKPGMTVWVGSPVKPGMTVWVGSPVRPGMTDGRSGRP